LGDFVGSAEPTLHSQLGWLIRQVKALAQLPIDPRVSVLCDAGKIESVNLAEIPALLKAFIQVMPVTARHPA
jgi:hypothetical protein